MEMLWGYGKYHACISLVACIVYALLQPSGYRNLADGRFMIMRTLIPQCIDKCRLITIRVFFQKVWRYIDAYWKGLNAWQAALANKQYKSHWKDSLLSDIITLMDMSDI